MRDLTLTFPQTQKRKTSTVSIRYLNLSILVSIIILAGLYLFGVTSTGTRNLEVTKLEQKVRELDNAQKQLQIEASDLQSINHIQTQSQKLNFVPASNVTYLKDSDFALK